MTQSQPAPPKLAHWLLNQMTSYNHRYGSFGDFEEEFQHISQKNSPNQARLWYWSQVFQSLPRYSFHLFYWRIIMIQTYFRIAWRLLTKQKGYSLINILGLAIGLAASLVLFLYIRFETQYDAYHPAADRIYRVAKSIKTATKTDLLATNVTEVAPTLKERFPEVEEAARAADISYGFIRVGTTQFRHDQLLAMDPAMLRLFHISLLTGDPSTALDRPDAILITTDIARKYFGSADPMGKLIYVDSTAYQVTGILAPHPQNTHLKYDLIKPLILTRDSPMHAQPWLGWHCMNYIRLAPGVNPATFESQIQRLPHEYQGNLLKQRGTEFTFFLQPLRDIHLKSHLSWELEPPGNALYIAIFSAVGIFILMIAIMNFINLSTARSAERASEVGIRKVIGAHRKQLIGQFLGETFLQALLAVILAACIVLIILPLFNSWTNLQLSLNPMIDPMILVYLSGLLLFTTLSGGGYSALYLSAFHPAAILKGIIKAGSKSTPLRKILVVGQFAISITLIVCTLLFYQQLQYMRTAPLGFSKEQKLILHFNPLRINANNEQRIKNEFLAHPSISKASFSSTVPGRRTFFWNLPYSGGGQEGRKMIKAMAVDMEFFETYDINILAGRKFEEGSNNAGWIINETCVIKNGWQDTETALQGFLGSSSQPIIGVVKDFHYRGLQQNIEPLAIFFIDEDYEYLTLNYDARQTSEMLQFVEATHRKLFPHELYQSFFLDEDFMAQYQAEFLRIRLFSGFAILGILISCMGLLGLSAFITQQRTKEIGIRKVLGASVPGIVFRLTREFILWVLLANLIAWPLAWWGMNLWLDDFAYRIGLAISPFVLAALGTLSIALLATAYQAIQASRRNPVDALKCE